MRLLLLRLAVTYRNELLLCLGVMLLLISLPVLAVVEIAGGGVAEASSTLAHVDPVTHLITIYDPKGNIETTMQATTAWPVGGVVTLEFGASDPPWQIHHTGIDIADPRGKIGRPVTVFMAGTVSKVVDYDNEYGKYVFVDHGNHIQSQYWHLSAATAKIGQHVSPGDVIGLEGMTGHATGPHVHFEIQVYGIPVGPRIFEVGSPPSGLDDPKVLLGVSG